MNKLILFPLLILTLVTLVAFFVNDTALPSDSTEINSGSWVNLPAGSGIWYWHDDSSGINWIAMSDTMADLDGYYSPYDAYHESPFHLVNLATGDVQYYDSLSDFEDHIGVETKQNYVSGIFNTPVFWAFVIGGITVATALGIQVFGTGLSEYSQKLALIAIIYAGVWIFLTVNSYSLLNDETIYPFGWLSYVGLTLMFIFGVVSDMEA